KKYQFVNKITAKVGKVDSKDMTLTIEVPGRSRGSGPHHEDISLAEDVKIRAMNLPEQFDEKNKPKPYTAAEKAKLKGDNPRLPGYTAELSRLAAGQTVEIELSTNKPAPGAAKKKDAAPEKPFATMVVIVAEEPKAMDKKKK